MNAVANMSAAGNEGTNPSRPPSSLPITPRSRGTLFIVFRRSHQSESALLEKGLSPSIPGTYIKLLRDNVLPPKWQDKAAANIGAEIVTLDSGHMAPLTHAKELAAILNSIAVKDHTH
jgi:hypothetical protein